MATVSKWTPFGVALDITATGGTVTRTSATQYTVVINASWETYYSGAQTNYGMTAASGGVTKTISAFNGTKRSNGSTSFTGTYSISGNGSATKTITVTFRNFNDDNDDSATKNVTFNVTVPAWTSYAIKYNANGGSGAPGNQTKWKDQTLTLSSTKPTRTGYSFSGWSTSTDASVEYTAGAKYTANAAATLYAVWKANTYAVTYNANGGSGAPGNQTKTYGVSLTLSSVKPTRTNYTFKGWATSASATVPAYASGGSYTTNAAITLYAVWELSYSKPKISSYSVTRCDSEGTTSDEGTYARVKFSWSTSREVESILIEWSSGAGDSGSYTVTTSGNSGNVDQIVGGGSLSTESTYAMIVTITDNGGENASTRSLAGMILPLDLLAGGKGIAFGKAAELAGYADVAYKMKHRDYEEFDNNKVIYGTSPDGSRVEAMNPQNSNGNTDIGYGNYDRGEGQTNIYGYDVMFGVANLATPGTHKPYLRRGDSFNVTLRTAGYVTNGSKDVSFWIPLSMPIIGSPKITVASANGFIFRQGNKYTHGSSADTYVTPTSYEATATYRNGIYVKALFSDITNVTNNDAIGIYWSGTITLS